MVLILPIHQWYCITSYPIVFTPSPPIWSMLLLPLRICPSAAYIVITFGCSLLLEELLAANIGCDLKVNHFCNIQKFKMYKIQ